MKELVEIFESYFNNKNIEGEPFLDNFWIRSNDYYVFFGEEQQMGKTYVLFSKKYFMTIELTKERKFSSLLNKIAEVIDGFRAVRGLSIAKYEFWLPHCVVNGITVETKLIAESFGISSELALDYLIHYDDIFSKIYDRKKGLYFGLPLLSSYDEAEKYILRDNTREYIKGLKKLKKLIR